MDCRGRPTTGNPEPVLFSDEENRLAQSQAQGQNLRKLASEKMQNRTARRIVNCHRRRSIPRRRRYTDESPPNVAEMPDPRDCIRIETIRKTPMMSWPMARAGFTARNDLVVGPPDSGPAHVSTRPRPPG